jgi:hypothetical protein
MGQWANECREYDLDAPSFTGFVLAPNPRQALHVLDERSEASLANRTVGSNFFTFCWSFCW